MPRPNNEWVGINHDGVSLDAPENEAVLFGYQERAVWIPRSEMKEYDDETLVIPRWLADARNMEPEFEVG